MSTEAKHAALLIDELNTRPLLILNPVTLEVMVEGEFTIAPGGSAGDINLWVEAETGGELILNLLLSDLSTLVHEATLGETAAHQILTEMKWKGHICREEGCLKKAEETILRTPSGAARHLWSDFCPSHGAERAL